MELHIEHITFDCHDAGKLAEFWSAATGLAIEDDQGDFVRLEPGQGGIRFAFQAVPPGVYRLHASWEGGDAAGPGSLEVAAGGRAWAEVTN